MTHKVYYLDTCIWLNLFKKEGDPTKGIPYWKIAEDFLTLTEKDSILVSTIVLKELTFKLEDKFDAVKALFKIYPNIQIIKTSPEDYDFARVLENKHKFNLSFYDYLHIAICKRIGAILITRDAELMSTAREYIEVAKPEHLLR